MKNRTQVAQRLTKALTGVLAGSLLGIASAPAGAVTLGFNTSPTLFTSAYTESGYQATFTGVNSNNQGIHNQSNDCSPTCADNGTPYLTALNSANSSYASTIIIKALDNSGFTFNGFDGAENPFANNAGLVWAAGILVTGIKGDASTVGQNFMFDQINDGIGGAADFQSFAFLSFFDVFVELQFTGIPSQNGGHDFSIDNLVLNSSSVPEPTSLLLLGIGLAGLGLSRRKLA